MNYDWDFSWVWNNLSVLFKGLGLTFYLTIATILLGLFLSLLITILRLSKRKIFNIFSQIYIEIFRDTPILVLLVWLFYCLPIFLGDSLRLSGFNVAIIGLALNFSALQAEIFRTGYYAIPIDQIKVAKSFGFRKLDILIKITLPQTFWRSLPPTLGQVVNTIKLTSLTSFIAVPELFHTTEQLIQESYRPLEFYTVLAFLYLIIIIPLSLLFKYFETNSPKDMVSDKSIIQLSNISKTFNGKVIFSNVNLTIETGEIIGIIGESGIGKSTLLKIIDKEIEPDNDSKVELNGVKSILIPQYPALWDNMNALQNVSLVRQILHFENKKVADKRASEYLKKLQIEADVFERYPNTLSGGEKQRVSIARGLASEIKLILLDEVTSNIDPENKSIVTDLITELSKGGFTIIFVTHDLYLLRNLDSKIYQLEKTGLSQSNKLI